MMIRQSAHPTTSHRVRTKNRGGWTFLAAPILYSGKLAKPEQCAGQKRKDALYQRHPSFTRVAPATAGGAGLSSLSAYFLEELLLLPIPLKYLKNSELGSTTITSWRLLKLAR